MKVVVVVVIAVAATLV